MIKELIDEGFTLEASAKKVEERIENLQVVFNKLQEKQENL